jgi:hypothetical protein
MPLQLAPTCPRHVSRVPPGIAAAGVPSLNEEKHEILIKQYVRELDTKGHIELDSDDGAEIYGSLFQRHRSITKLTPEELRRAMLVVHLVYEKGYGYLWPREQ